MSSYFYAKITEATIPADGPERSKKLLDSGKKWVGRREARSSPKDLITDICTQHFDCTYSATPLGCVGY